MSDSTCRMTRCHDCGRDWPHGLLYASRADIDARVRGRCADCHWFGRKQLRLWESGKDVVK